MPHFLACTKAMATWAVVQIEGSNILQQNVNCWGVQFCLLGFWLEEPVKEKRQFLSPEGAWDWGCIWTPMPSCPSHVLKTPVGRGRIVAQVPFGPQAPITFLQNSRPCRGTVHICIFIQWNAGTHEGIEVAPDSVRHSQVLCLWPNLSTDQKSLLYLRTHCNSTAWNITHPAHKKRSPNLIHHPAPRHEVPVPAGRAESPQQLKDTQGTCVESGPEQGDTDFVAPAGQ